MEPDDLAIGRVEKWDVETLKIKGIAGDASGVSLRLGKGIHAVSDDIRRFRVWTVQLRPCPFLKTEGCKSLVLAGLFKPSFHTQQL